MLPLLTPDAMFPRPDWNAVYERQSKMEFSDAERNTFWADLGREWMHLLRPCFGSDYKIYESSNFWLVSDQPEKMCRLLINWAETTRAKVLNLVDVGATKHLFGKCPIIVVSDLNAYDQYCAFYIPEDQLGPSGGVFLNHGYGHFIFPFHNINQAEPVLVHELAHSLVSHLPLPPWVNEGVAQLCENIISHSDGLDYEKIKDIKDTFWTTKTIQEFWSGAGFCRFDDGQLLNYHLAREVTRELAADRVRFLAFLVEVDADDFGAAALLKHFNLTASDLLADYLGAGDWSPRRPPSGALPE